MHMAMRCGESQESIKVFNWNIFSKFRLNLIQILIIKNMWLSFLILTGNIKKKKGGGRGVWLVFLVVFCLVVFFVCCFFIFLYLNDRL